MIRIKVCGMVDPVNLRDIIEMKPDFVGFIFYPGSKRYVGKNPDKKLFADVPPEIKKTGVFVNEDPAMLQEIVKSASLDIIQLHGNESVDYCRNLKSSGLSIIKAFGIGSDFDFRITGLYSEVCDYFLFDAKSYDYGGTGIRFDWNELKNQYFNKPFFLSGGIGPGDAYRIKEINNKCLFAVDINSRFEILPGIKDREKISVFLNSIKH